MGKGGTETGVTKTDNPFSDLHEAFQPRLRAFFAVDLVGSTAHKQAEGVFTRKFGEDPRPSQATWLMPLLDFYQNFDCELAKNVEACKSAVMSYGELDHGFEPLEIWKTVGDELLYTQKITDVTAMQVSVSAWRQTVLAMRQTLHEHYNDFDLKSYVWVANFPLINSEVILEIGRDPQCSILPRDQIYKDSFHQLKRWYDEKRLAAQAAQAENRPDPGNRPMRGHFYRDFVGPQIDTGFRLGQHANPKRLLLSIEALYILASQKTPKGINSFKFGFDDKHVLNGVIRNEPYPVFSIDMAIEDEMEALEREFQGRPMPNVDREKCVAYAKHFFSRSNGVLIRPFIAGCRDTEVSQFPPDYERILKDWVKDIEGAGR